MPDVQTPDLAAKESDFAARVAEMKPELEALLAKHQITLGAKLNYLGDAIVPSPTYVDTKPQPEPTKSE